MQKETLSIKMTQKEGKMEINGVIKFFDLYIDG